MHLVQRARFCLFGLFLGIATLLPARARGQDRCAICSALIPGTVYLMTDRVTGDRVEVCESCTKLATICFRCGLPVKTGFETLPDGRVLCARDAKDAIMDDDTARQTIMDVQDTLDRLLSRFMTFPQTNLETAIVDRVNLTALFSLPGHDYSCPNVLGYTQSRTNGQGRISHKISVLSGLASSELKAVCAHELTHAWVFENVSRARRKTLGSDAHEGFCELIAYLLADAEGDEAGKGRILQNQYTRGQINLFIQAENRFGLNDVVEWMKSGQDAVLHGDALDRIHNLVEPPAKHAAAVASYLPVLRPKFTLHPPAEASDFELKGVSWSPAHPMAMINNRTFELNEQGQVRVAGTNVVIRCVAIRPNGARLRVLATGQERDLSLAAR